MDKNSSPLKVALHAMDERSCKVMVMYLQGPCRGFAVVVDDSEAEVDIFDGDNSNATRLIDERLAKKLARPVVVLSLHDGKLENVLYIKKPVRTDDMLHVLQNAKDLAQKLAQTSQATVSSGSAAQSESGELNDQQPVLKRFVLDENERNKKTKHEAAMQLNEKGFGAFIGNVAGVDVNDPTQFMLASYNPKEYFQGFVASAFKASNADGKAKQLNSGWNPLFIFPQNHEVWLDADEKQLRAFAGLTISNMVGAQVSLHTIDAETAASGKALEKYHSMDAFLWKLACWASKGRYPVSLTIQQPVYLKNWPNFTRLLVTPHALRIAALLIKEPRTLPSIAEVLDIKPQYVFVFISAAHSLGLVDQAKRSADLLVDSSTAIKPNKNQGLLGRIMSKLRS
ncbi:MAG: hypothetical protein WAX77_15060 [Methylococcaceae bacterium]